MLRQDIALMLVASANVHINNIKIVVAGIIFLAMLIHELPKARLETTVPATQTVFLVHCRS